MSPHPIGQEIRRRLLEAQRAEADALKAVELAVRARDRAEKRRAEAQAELDGAKVVLIRCSGISRAALLLGQTESAMRRIYRCASRTSSSPRAPEEGRQMHEARTESAHSS